MKESTELRVIRRQERFEPLPRRSKRLKVPLLNEANDVLAIATQDL